MQTTAAMVQDAAAMDQIDVTRSNFAQTLPRVERALHECTYFAIDCEMTGSAMPQAEQGRSGSDMQSMHACMHAWASAGPPCHPPLLLHAGLTVDGGSQDSFLDDMGDRCAQLS
jgi:hypothetical protein